MGFQGKKEEFETIKEGRRYLKKIRRHPKLLLAFPYPESWDNFDGKFEVEFPCKRNDDNVDNYEICETALKEQMSRKYPNEPFELRNEGPSYEEESPPWNTKSWSFRVICRKSLFEKMKSDPMVSSQYRALDVRLETVWKR